MAAGALGREAGAGAATAAATAGPSDDRPSGTAGLGLCSALLGAAAAQRAAWPSLLLVSRARGPVLDGEALESRKVLHVGGHQN